MKKKKTLSRWKWWIIGALSTVALCGVASLLIYIAIGKSLAGLEGMMGNNCPNDEPANAESYGRFELPPSYTNLKSFCGGMQGWSVDASFNMKPEDLDALVESLWLEADLQPTGEPQHIFFRDGETPFEEIASYLYAVTTSGTDLLQEVLIDTSDPESYFVYLVILAG